MLLENPPEKFGDFFKLTRFFFTCSKQTLVDRQLDDAYYFWSKGINRHFWLLILFFGTFCVKLVTAGRRADESENILLFGYMWLSLTKNKGLLWFGQVNFTSYFFCIVDVSMCSYSVFYSLSPFIWQRMCWVSIYTFVFDHLIFK